MRLCWGLGQLLNDCCQGQAALPVLESEHKAPDGGRRGFSEGTDPRARRALWPGGVGLQLPQQPPRGSPGPGL